MRGVPGLQSSVQEMGVKMRRIKTHEVNGLNKALLVEVQDAPGPGGACYEYQIRKFMTAGTQMTFDVGLVHISFQKGPVTENGVNGVSNEALLAIVRDRLECFQRGDFACTENQTALDHVVAAMVALHNRTRDRVVRGVEGTSSL